MPLNYDVLTYEDRKKQKNLGHDMSGVSTAGYNIAVADSGGKKGVDYTDPQNQVKPNKSQYNATNKYQPFKIPSYAPSYVGASSLSRIGAFEPSQAYLDAMSYTQGLLDKINSGRTSYSDRVDAMMDKIANREKFSYDFNTDPLFQNMLAGAMASGQTAMQDTIGQASALTGGYGSSYATSVGNQAYNNYVQDAYAQLPEYYQLALNAYNMEGDEMYRQLGMYNDADDKEYGRLTNAYGLNYQKAQDMYGQEYNNYWDTANYNLSVDKYNADNAMEAAKFNATQAYNAAKFNYEKEQDALKQKSASGSGTSSEANAGASSADFQKAINYAEDLLKTYNYDSEAMMAGVTRIANQFGLSEAQVNTLWSQLDAANGQKQIGIATNMAKTSVGTATNATVVGADKKKKKK